MPKTAYERKAMKVGNEQSSIDSASTLHSESGIDIDVQKIKVFYKSIPDYNDINHLPPEEFYSTLNILRKQKSMLGYSTERMNDFDRIALSPKIIINNGDGEIPKRSTTKTKKIKSELNSSKRKHSLSRIKTDINRKDVEHNMFYGSQDYLNAKGTREFQKMSVYDLNKATESLTKTTRNNSNELLENINYSKLPRNHSAHSIMWSDCKNEDINDIDHKFDQIFEGKNYAKKGFDDEFKTRSMPASPLRNRKGLIHRRKSLTIPKPFKMTERDEDARQLNDLRCIRKCFSDDMLNQKRERKVFRARPVPIESRIPLYDKIMEDQAMRRAITKINSEAELRAQMKPFKFTQREEEQGLTTGICEKAMQLVPKPKKKKRFKARPLPKNLFSNYIFDKIKQDNFFRSVNRRIRAEEMLKNSSLPGSMGTRDRSRMSTPAAHSDLPRDPSPLVPSISSSGRIRAVSPDKGLKKRNKIPDFITTSPQPFRLMTADRAAKKMEEITKKIYACRSVPSDLSSGNRAYSALDLRAQSVGRSNLAAMLRAEAVRRRFEMEAERRLMEQRRKVETKTRDRILRSSNPAWQLVKNDHEEDIAMRLQTRRDEERMRREEFLHEMELMYGRVQQQPMMFERYYVPRYGSTQNIEQLSPRKKTKHRTTQKSKSRSNSPDKSRKVSINDTTETFNDNVFEYLNTIENRKCSESEAAESGDEEKG